MPRLLDELELVDVDEILRLLPPSPVFLFVVDLDELLELFEELLEDEELSFFDLSLDDTDPEELLLLLLVVDVDRTEDGELTDESDNSITSSAFGAFQGLTSFVVVGVVTFGVVGVGDEEDL